MRTDLSIEYTASIGRLHRRDRETDEEKNAVSRLHW